MSDENPVFVWHQGHVWRRKVASNGHNRLHREQKKTSTNKVLIPTPEPDLAIGDQVFVRDWCYWDDTRGIVESAWDRGLRLLPVTNHCESAHNVYVDGQKVMQAACFPAMPNRLRCALANVEVDMRSNTSVPF